MGLKKEFLFVVLVVFLILKVSEYQNMVLSSLLPCTSSIGANVILEKSLSTGSASGHVIVMFESNNIQTINLALRTTN